MGDFVVINVAVPPPPVPDRYQLLNTVTGEYAPGRITGIGNARKALAAVDRLAEWVIYDHVKGEIFR